MTMLRPGTRLRQMAVRGRAMAGVSAWTPGDLTGTPREWLAGPDWCYTDGSAAFAAASSQYLSVASNSTLQTGDVDFWVAGWVRQDTDTNQTFVSKYDNASQEWFIQNGGASRYRFGVSANGTNDIVVLANTFGWVPTGTWVFILCWHDAANNTINIKVNNTAADSAAHSGGVYVGAAPLFLGALQFGTPIQPLNGRLASVAFGKSPPGGIASVISTISSRLYASGSGIVYADTTAAERTDWGLVSWWDLVRSGVFTDSHGSNNLTNNNGVTFGAGLPRSRAGDTDPISAWVDRWQGTLVTQSDPLKRPTLRLVGGKWVVRFDGVNDGMFYSGAVYASQPVTFGYATNPTNAGLPQGNVFDTYGNGPVARLLAGIFAGEWRLYAGAGDLFGGTYATGWTTAAGLVSGASSVLRRNGAQIAAGNPGTVALPTGVVIGNDYALTNEQAWEGDIASVVLTGADASAEFARLEAYLGGLY